MRWLLVAVIMLFSTSMILADEAVMEDGRARSQDFMVGELTGIWDETSPDLRELIGSLAAFEAFRAGVASDFGEETDLLSETVQTSEGIDNYLRTSRWSLVDAPMVLQWGIAEDGEVVAFSIRPLPVAAESRFLDYQTRTLLRLPFVGEWQVVWGGRTLELNHHAANRAQTFRLGHDDLQGRRQP